MDQDRRFAGQAQDDRVHKIACRQSLVLRRFALLEQVMVQHEARVVIFPRPPQDALRAARAGNDERYERIGNMPLEETLPFEIRVVPDV
jgi:hypothetical protein